MKGKCDKRAEGGAVKSYSAPNNVEKEADEKKHGGRVKRKHGGRMSHEERIEGKKSKMRLDRPGRKSGGRVGADKMPLSSAAHLTQAVGHKTSD